MAIRSAFISSLIEGFKEYRDSAKLSVERSRMRPVMSEHLPAQDRAPRAACLDEAGRADVFLLLLGAKYGADQRPSPTEEEYEEAIRCGRPVLVMVQTGVEREAQQQAFLDRVTSGWAGGRYRGHFANPGELAAEVAHALHDVEQLFSGGETAIPQARERVAALLGASSRQVGGWPPTDAARLAIVPVGGTRLVRASQLNSGDLESRVVELARTLAVVDTMSGFEASADASGVSLRETGSRFDNESVNIRLETDGSLLAQGPITGREGLMRGMWIDPRRLTGFLRSALALGPALWEEIGAKQSVRQAAIQFVIPRADSRSYGQPRGSSVSMGGMGRLGDLIVPSSPALVPPGDLQQGTPITELVAEVERAFRDVGAINQ